MLTRDMADGVYEIPESTYHADRERLSNSAIGMFLKDRRKFVKQYVRGEKVSETKKAHFSFGGLFHSMLFEPDTTRDRFAVVPETYGDLFRDLCEECPKDKAGKPTHKGSNAYKQWAKLQGKKQIVEAVDAGLSAAMVKAIAEHPIAKDVIFDPELLRERVLCWNDEATGEPMRARLDGHLPPSTRPLIVELKTIEGRVEHSPIENPDALAAHCFKYAYNRAAAVYIDGYKAVYGVYPLYIAIFVEKREEDPMVVVKQATFDSDSVIDGRSGLTPGLDPLGYRPAIQQIQALREKEDWRFRHELGITEWTLPDWRVRQIGNGPDLCGFEGVA